MSYRVDYTPETRDRYPSRIKVRRKLPIRPAIVSVATVAIIYCIVSSGVLRLLIPGDPAVTTAAFDGMVDDIGAGDSVRNAFLTFCKEIIVNAD